VLASIEAWSRDPAWLYPIAITFLGGEVMPEQETADTWRKG
jgi:hypothetical protein